MAEAEAEAEGAEASEASMRCQLKYLAEVSKWLVMRGDQKGTESRDRRAGR